MRFHSAITTFTGAGQAVGQLLEDAPGMPSVQLAALFFTPELTPSLPGIAAGLRDALKPEVFLACSCQGVIGRRSELETGPAAALLAASMPGVGVHPFRLEPQSMQAGRRGPDLRAAVPAGARPAGCILLADPFTTPAAALLPALDDALEGAAVSGGMASAADAPGGNTLALSDRTFTDGAVGVVFTGPVRMDTIVSQGCKPVGSTLLVTRCRGNVVQALGGRPALEVLEAEIRALPAAERQLLRNGVFLGIAIDEYRHAFGPGDFLVRAVVGADTASGEVAIADSVRQGQTVQLHLRDAGTASEDLRLLLKMHADLVEPAAGGFLFSCNGRGERMFGCSAHDIEAAARLLPGVPLAGFFAAGELGPVGGRTFLHGHTASFALLRPAR